MLRECRHEAASDIDVDAPDTKELAPECHFLPHDDDERRNTRCAIGSGGIVSSGKDVSDAAKEESCAVCGEQSDLGKPGCRLCRRT